MRPGRNPQDAETVALNVLGFLAESPQAMEKLMIQSGLDLSTIRKRTADRDFLAAVVDFLMSNEELLVDFCQTRGIDPKTVQLAAHQLGGA
jgi:Protein of unknown function (DUF3572)